MGGRRLARQTVELGGSVPKLQGWIVNTKKLWVALIAGTAIFLGGVGSMEAQPQPKPALQAPTPQGIPWGKDLADLESRLQGSLQQEISVKTAAAVKHLSTDARQIHERTDLLIKYVGWVSSVFLGILTLFFGAFLAIGWREIGLVTSAREAVSNAKTEVDRAGAEAAVAATGAASSAQTIRAMEQEVGIASERVRAFDRALVASIENLATTFSELSMYEAEPNLLAGDLPDFPSNVVVARHEEADILLVLADKTNAVEKSKLVNVFITLGFDWRIVRNYPRALARFARALEIDPRAPRAHAGLCVTYYTLALNPRWQARQKEALLVLADMSCNALLEIAPHDPDAWFHRGWIADERGDFGVAVDAYSRARELDPAGDSYVMFNMACSYSKWGRQAEAFTALSEVIGVDHNWEDAERDSELQRLRDDPELGPRLADLVSRERERAREAPRPSGDGSSSSAGPIPSQS